MNNKYERPVERFEPPKNLSNRVNTPNDTILVITNHDSFNDLPNKYLQDLKGEAKRDWFLQHAYFCLPLKIGNQHGIILKAAYDFRVFWNGGETPNDVMVDAPTEKQHIQNISSHFGMGTFTVQSPWQYRTPKGVNLLVFNPPNYFIDGIVHMTAMVETDNLRRDFTFNLRITRPNHWIDIKEGTPIGCILPYPRHFFDNYEIKMAKDTLPQDVINDERKTGDYFGIERSKFDSKYKGAIGGRYMEGVDIYNNKFEDHQKTLK